MRPWLQPKTVLAIDIMVKGINVLCIINKMEHFSLIIGCVVSVAKHLKEDWFIVLR